MKAFILNPLSLMMLSPNRKSLVRKFLVPVLSTLTFNTEQEAIELANNTCYGLAAYVATENYRACAETKSEY